MWKVTLTVGIVLFVLTAALAVWFWFLVEWRAVLWAVFVAAPLCALSAVATWWTLPRAVRQWERRNLKLR